MKSKINQFSEKYLNLAKHAVAPRPIPPLPKTTPLFGGPSTKKNILENKPVATELSDEEKQQIEFARSLFLAEKEDKLSQQAKKEKEERIKQEKEFQKKIEEEEQNNMRLSEALQSHPEFKSIFSFVDFLNENNKDVYSSKQLKIMSEIHKMDLNSLKSILGTAGKFEIRTDRKIRTPSELIELAAEKLGKNKQQIFDVLLKHVKEPEDSPLSLGDIIKVVNYQGLTPKEIRVQQLRERQNLNKADDGESEESEESDDSEDDSSVAFIKKLKDNFDLDVKEINLFYDN